MSELIYTLGEEKKDGKHFLTLQIQKKGEKRQLYRDTLRLYGKAPELTDFIIKAQLSHLKISPLDSAADTVTFNRVYIERSKALELLQKLASAPTIMYLGKKITIDLKAPARYFWRSTGNRNEWKIEGIFSIGPIEWIFPSDPTVILSNGTLYLSKFESKWIYPTPLILKGQKASDFFDDYHHKKVPGIPDIEWQIIEIPKVEPLPFLVLKDRSGAFADLWIDYGDDRKVCVADPTHFPWRDEKVERFWEKDLFESGFVAKRMENCSYFCPLNLTTRALSFLIEMGWPVFDVGNRRVLIGTGHNVQMSEGERIQVTGTARFGDKEVDVKRLFDALKRREPLLVLDAQHVGLIEWEKAAAEWGEEVIAGHGSVKRSHFALLEPESSFSTLSTLRERMQTATPAQEFQGTLYPYQQEGLNWLDFLYRNRFGALLADEMGLGKTVQVLSFLSRLDIEKPILIVAPTTLLFQWKKEWERFLPHLPLGVFPQNGRAILTSYAQLRLNPDFFKSIHYSCIVLDEAQTIKNPSSQIANCACELNADFKIAVTGTPLENRWEDLWSIFRFILPDLLGEKSAFQAQTASPLSLRSLKRKLRPFILRRKKEEVLKDLPEKEEQLVWVEMEEDQKALYDNWKLRKKLQKNGSATRIEILELILRLRQFCCHPLLVDPSATASSGKFQRLMEDVESVLEEKRKVLIYSQFTGMLQLIRKELDNLGHRSLYLDGSTTNRQEVVEQFQNDPEALIFLVSLKAGGVGLNLTAADYVFIYDPWWNDAVERQAIDRAHRLGRKGVVIARRYLTVQSIEEKILALKLKKGTLAEGILENDPIDAITIEDLMLLIE